MHRRRNRGTVGNNPDAGLQGAAFQVLAHNDRGRAGAADRVVTRARGQIRRPMKQAILSGPYRPLAQLGAGTDGVSYRAVGAEGIVELRVLSAARGHTARWPSLAKRLQLASLLDHPAALRIHRLSLESDPPYLALEWAEAEIGGTAKPVPVVLRSIVALAGAVAAAHRLGLAHGRIGVDRALLYAEGGGARLDFTGVETRPPAEVGDGGDPGTVPGSENPAGLPDFAADVHALGALILAAAGRDGSRSGETAHDALDRLVSEMMAPEPADRPAAAEVRNRLALIVAGDASPGLDMGRVAEARVALEADDATSDFELAALPPSPSGLSPREGQGRLRLLERLGRPVAGPAAPPTQLGRYRVLEQIGRGGMGAVYRAQDLADGSIVALKVQNPEWARRPEALRRFRKEARLLAEVNNPFITNLLEANEDDGVPFLVLEYVAGITLGRHLATLGRLEERVALTILADVARGLADAHGRGIVHRDVKPDNILFLNAVAPADTGFALEGQEAGGDDQGGAGAPTAALFPELPRVKLSDFGIARRVFEAEALTVPGGVLGTPLYMAPEQGSGAAIGPGADVYAMGATLYHMLAGRPPFLGDDHFALMAKHRDDPLPSLLALAPEVSGGAIHIVETALSKAVGARYPDASALLRDLESLLRGEPISVSTHPKLPSADAAGLLEYRFTWDLEASPRELWPFVSDTERLNRAVGLPAVDFSSLPGGLRGSHQIGTFRKLGMRATWEEHPFEWVEGRRMGVLREYSRGPVRWLASVVELTPRAGGGTTLLHHVRLLPRGVLGRGIMHVEVGIRGHHALDRVYRRIDASIADAERAGRPDADPFEGPPPPAGSRRRRLAAALEALVRRGVLASLVERLGEFLDQAPSQEVARIRPLVLARRWGLDPEPVVAACLQAAGEGLLILNWELVCPACRLPSENRPSLRDLPDRRGRCDVCQMDFELDFAESVELVFRADPRVRAADTGIYCIGGPAHFPHVVAQVRASPGERVELDLALAAGAYRVRAPQLPYVFDFRVVPSASAGFLEISLAAGPASTTPRALRPGSQRLTFANDCGREVVLRLERIAARADALTAARASSLALFRELFPAEVLAPGQLIRVTHVTLLVTGLEDAGNLYEEMGDARAFGILHDHLRRQDDAVRRAGGAPIKTVGDGILAAFSDPVAALRAGLALRDLAPAMSAGRALRPRLAIHRGPALTATLDDRLDYFGATVSRVGSLLASARGGELVLSETVAADPAVSALLCSLDVEGIPHHAVEAGRAIVLKVSCPSQF